MKSVSRLFSLLIIAVSSILFHPAEAQEQHSDSLLYQKIMQDNLELFRTIDSLDKLIAQLNANAPQLRWNIDSLVRVNSNLSDQLLNHKKQNDSLLHVQASLSHQLLILKQERLQCTNTLAEQAQLLRDKEFELSRVNARLKDIENNSELSQVKLKSQLDVHSAKLEAKDREIVYLQKSVEEKDNLLRTKNDELLAFYQYKDNTLKIIDSLNKSLSKSNLELVRITERQTLVEAQLNEMKEKQAAAQNKKKKIRFIQGVGLKNYRTPDWELAPQSASSTGVYVISNKNAGNIDFDYITGVSLSIYDLSKEKGKFTYDAGLFVGFGGQNLFKNFYIGPSFKLFDYFHLNAGVNIAEYQQLKPGFGEGDALPAGYSMSTIMVKEWKAKAYIGFTVDFELLTNIPKKM